MEPSRERVSGDHTSLDLAGLLFQPDIHVGVAVCEALTTAPEVVGDVAAEEADHTEIVPLTNVDKFVDHKTGEAVAITFEVLGVDEYPVLDGHGLNPMPP